MYNNEKLKCPYCLRKIIIKIENKNKCLCCFCDFYDTNVKIKNNSRLIHCRNVLRELSFKKYNTDYYSFLNSSFLLEKKNIEMKTISYNITDKKRKSYILLQQIYDDINEKYNQLNKESIDKILFIVSQYIIFLSKKLSKTSISINYSIVISNITNNFNIGYVLKKKLFFNDFKNLENLSYWNDFFFYFINKWGDIKMINIDNNLELNVKRFKYKEIESSKFVLKHFDLKNLKSVETNDNNYIKPIENSNINSEAKKINIFLNNKYINSYDVLKIQNKKVCIFCKSTNNLKRFSAYFNFYICSETCLYSSIYYYKELDIDTLYNYNKNKTVKPKENLNCHFCNSVTSDKYCDAICEQSFEYILNKFKNPKELQYPYTIPLYIINLDIEKLYIIKNKQKTYQSNLIKIEPFKDEILVYISWV